MQIVGSYFGADTPWLIHAGLDLRKRYFVPEDIDDFRGGDWPGMFDVALACHAIEETAEFKLEKMAVRHLGMRRWDVELNEWKRRYTSERSEAVKEEGGSDLEEIDADKLEGYGECPDDILYPYGARDVVAPRRLRDKFCKLLSSDRLKQDCWRGFHISSLAFPAFVEMSTTGFTVDEDRVREMTELYIDIREELRQRLRAMARWPNFNDRSHFHVKELLFGEELNGKDKVNGKAIRLRPEGAVSLGLEPIKTTGKPARSWVNVVKAEETHIETPCTDKETLGIYSGDEPIANVLRQIRFIDQLLKTTLKEPVKGKDREYIYDEDDNPVVRGGFLHFTRNDGRVHPRLFQTKETGRASAADPNLMALSKRREEDYANIAGSRYLYPVRSCLTGDLHADEPTCIIEADYSGAELLGVGVYARDKNLIAHCQDPNYDIHSNVAVLAFRLDCEASKAGLAAIGKKALRIAAKNVVFGANYGRGAAAIARQCREEGVDLSVEDAQLLLDTLDQIYPRVKDFKLAAGERVTEPAWLRGTFGRMRRFVPSDDPMVLAGSERQAVNFYIQNLVADAVSLALYKMMTHPLKRKLGYRVALSVHDAIVLEAPIRYANECQQLLSDVMESITFPSCDLDGVPFEGSEEYRFIVDSEVQLRWGIDPTWAECDKFSLDRKWGKQFLSYDGEQFDDWLELDLDVQLDNEDELMRKSKLTMKDGGSFLVAPLKSDWGVHPAGSPAVVVADPEGDIDRFSVSTVVEQS